MDVLLTGGAGGIGRTAAVYLAEKGVRVFSCDIAEQTDAHKNIVPLSVDITAPESIEKAYREVAEKTDGLAAIISIAGVYVMDSFVEVPEENLSKIIDVNLMGVYRINKAFLPLLQDNGRIIITTSEVAGLKQFPFNGMYGMSKTALECYADSLRLELQLLGIKVINIKPGAFDTKLVDNTHEQAKRMAENTKLYKMGTKRFLSIMQSKTGTAKDPEILAKVYYKALTAKRPKLTYYKNAGLGMKLYSLLPRRLAAFVIRLILKG